MKIKYDNADGIHAIRQDTNTTRSLPRYNAIINPTMPITPAAAPETAVGVPAPAADVALERKPEASVATLLADFTTPEACVATLLAPEIPVLIPPDATDATLLAPEIPVLTPPEATDATLFAPVNAVSKTDVTPPITCVVKEEYTLPPPTGTVVPVVVVSPLVSVLVKVVPVSDGVEVTLVVKVLPAEFVVVIAITIGIAGPEVEVGRNALTPDSRAANWLDHSLGIADSNHPGILKASRAS